VTLCEKGLKWETRNVDLFRAKQYDPEYLKLNPKGLVPTLVHDGVPIIESTLICEYLEDRYPEPALYPADARLRAKCRLIEDLADTQLDAATYAVAVVEMGRGEVHPGMHDAAERDLTRLYDELERHLGEAAFFCGSYSLADIAVVPHVLATSFLGFGLDPERHSHLLQWLGRVQERSAVMQDNADVLGTLQRLQEEKRPAFDPYRVQWRSDRLEWVIKNGFATWFMEEMKTGRAFFPLPAR